ncbi:adenylate kinase [Spizellomyces sp. 'palustris']|nr:adenylate kinase [Spizellomyces sp. 'palustris']
MDLSDSDTPDTPPNIPKRQRPNILVTGTPGTGKTTTSELIAIATGLEHVEVGSLVKERGLHQGWDGEFQSWLLDEDKVIDELEPMMLEGGKVVDHHGCDFFPERWFDLVVVLRTDNQILYPRLEQRNYSEKKIQENVECEIMQVVLEEAWDSYRPEIVWEMRSESIHDMEENVQQISDWVDRFMEKS